MPPTQTQNRKDLLQAYRLMTQRTALALIAGEPDSPNQPLRRRSTATVSGILVGVIVCVLFGVLGGLHIIGTPEQGLSQTGTLVIDKDTGTTYVKCDKTALCPTLNYTSALLILKNGQPNRKSVNQSQLAGTKIGPTLGVMGLPQDLPTKSNLVKGPWAVCDNGRGTSTLVGGQSVGGTPLAGSTASLVKSLGQDYVLLNGQRMKISPAYIPLFHGDAPTQVTPAWLNAVPAGADFAPPPVPGFNTQPGNSPVSGKIGQVFVESTASGQNSFVLEQDGKLHPVDQLQATLLETEPNAPGPQPVTPSVATANSGSRVAPGGLPSTLPHTAEMQSPLCYTYATSGKQAITTGATVPTNATPTGNNSPTTVNQVSLPAGHGALIGMASKPGSTSASAVSSWVLLSGATRYGLNGKGVASDLGYKLPADGTVLPASLVSVLPQGPGLDATAAAQPASAAAQPASG